VKSDDGNEYFLNGTCREPVVGANRLDLEKENPPGREALKQVIKRVRPIPVTGNAYDGTL